MNFNCKKCGAPIDYDDNSEPTKQCSHCGAVNTIPNASFQINKTIYRDETEIHRIDIDNSSELDLRNRIEKYEERKLANKVSIIKYKIQFLVIALFVVVIFIFTISLKIAAYYNNNIPVGTKSSALLNQHFDSVSKIIYDAGFSNIDFIIYDDLNNPDKVKENLVSKITINGVSNFSSSKRFPKNSSVTICYHILDPNRPDEIQIPRSSDAFQEEDIKVARTILENVGFKNIEYNPIYDISLWNKSSIGKIDNITIKGYSKFSTGDWFDSSDIIIISFHSDTDYYEQFLGKIQIFDSSKKFIDKPYSEVLDSIQKSGFTNVKTVPLADLSYNKQKNNDKVAEIEIDGCSEFDKGTYFFSDAEVVIKYHSQAVVANNSQIILDNGYKYFTGKKYDIIVDELKELGFSNVSVIALNDIQHDFFRRSNEIESISFDGNTNVNAGDCYEKDCKIIIKYHSMKSE